MAKEERTCSHCSQDHFQEIKKYIAKWTRHHSEKLLGIPGQKKSLEQLLNEAVRATQTWQCSQCQQEGHFYQEGALFLQRWPKQGKPI